MISDPLRLGPSRPLGRSAQGRLPQHNVGGWKREPHDRSGSVTLAVVSAVPTPSWCSIYSQAPCVLYIFWVAFSLPKCLTAILSHSWLGREFYWSIWLSLVYSVQCFRRPCCVQGKNKKVARK